MKNIIPDIEEYDRDSHEYINSLEMAVELLKREVENLRSQIRPISISPTTSEQSNKFLDIKSSFQKIKNYDDIVTNLQNILSKYFNIFESTIFQKKQPKTFKAISQANASPNLVGSVKSLEEEGIIDWAIEKKGLSVVPNFNPESVSNMYQILIIPLFLLGNNLGFYAAFIDSEKFNSENEILEEINFIAEYASIAIDNLRSSFSISEMNNKLDILNKQMSQSSKLASIGELTSSLAKEIDLPLQILSANVQLIQNGVGDSNTRLEVIKQQVEEIQKINKRLAGLSEIKLDKTQSAIDVCELINEVLSFISNRMQRDGIIINKTYEELKINILAWKNLIQQAIMNIILFCRDAMPDGGNITVGVFKPKEKKVLISISDDSSGMDENELHYIFELGFNDMLQKKSARSLFLTKNIIEQHKGQISVFSEVGKGNTFKILFPIEF